VPHLAAGLRYLLETDCRGILNRLDAPILILHGERDQVIPAAAARLLAEALPQARLEILPEGNHALLHTHPQWILEKIRTRAPHSALSTQHSAQSSQSSALSTQHSAQSSQSSALSTQHSALSSERSALSSQSSALSTQHSALSSQHSAFSSPRSRGIAHSFSEAARNYAETAGPQRAIAGRLIELLPKMGADMSVVDVGCGTGFLIEHLHALYPAARILGLDLAPGMIEACRKRWSGAPGLSFAVADAETYEPAETFDLVISNLCFQWLDRPDEALRRWVRALRPGGQIAASIPVERSLVEIHASYLNAVGSKLPGMVFLATEYFLDVLACAGLKLRVIHEESPVFRFHNALEVLRALKAAGASFRHLPGYVPRSVGELNQMLDYYNAHYALPDGGVSLTYRMLYFVAEAPA
jgi:malonyl-CoA O-methyltransferase